MSNLLNSILESINAKRNNEIFDIIKIASDCKDNNEDMIAELEDYMNEQKVIDYNQRNKNYKEQIENENKIRKNEELLWRENKNKEKKQRNNYDSFPNTFDRRNFC